MYRLMSLPLGESALSEYSGWDDLRAELEQLECDGIEAIWSGEDFPADFPRELAVGYHLTFYADWLDFWREDEAALLRKFGSMDMARGFYGGLGRETLMARYREDLDRAAALGARYVVFHVSDVSIEEGYTYRWLHTSREVIDASVEVINALLEGCGAPFDFLVENQWWPGFTFTEPDLTARLLEGVRWPRKGILLDTGHLMNCCPRLRTEREGADYIHAMLDKHGELCRWIKGVHLHQSLSGEYVGSHTGFLPALPADYLERFAVNYQHVLRIDQHRPWSDPAAGDVVARIAPRYLTHEISGRRRLERYSAVRRQNLALAGRDQ